MSRRQRHGARPPARTAPPPASPAGAGLAGAAGWVYVHDLDPVLVELGPLSVGWYGLMYAVSFLFVYWMLLRSSRRPGALVPHEEVPNLLTYIIIGVVVGGRLGWVTFYGGLEYFVEPWRILETWKGGMSFHGGLLGVILAAWLYARRHRIAPLDLADYGVTWVPVGLFFGRVGNFINGELYGMPTDGSWGVIFPGDPQRMPRHPSQLYEAFGEGIVLFAALLALRRWVPWRGLQPAAFILLYGAARFLVEFVRLPDAHIGYLAWGWLTMGQVLSFPMIAVGGAWCAWVAWRRRPGALAEVE